VNAGVRPIDLAAFYPGDDAVDIVGIDAYDAGVPTNQTDRWHYLTTRTDGIGDVERFAAAHDKPMSIPEWGVGPASSSNRGGDDPAYVDGIASVVRNNRFVYQSYFYNYDYATQLATGPLSLAAYIKHFGTAAQPPPPTVAPPPPPSVAPSPPYPAPAPSVPVPAAAPSPPNFSTSAPAAKPAKAAPRHRAKRPHRKHKSHRRKRARRHA
jgi:hypothetical protein